MHASLLFLRRCFRCAAPETAAILALLACLMAGGALAAIGDSARVEGTLVEGSRYSIEAQRGKVVLVVMWATWCPICRRELPKLEKFYEANSAKGFEILALSVDDTPQVVSDFVARNHYTFPIGWRAHFKDNLGLVRGTPTMVLIDRQGNIRARSEGALDDEAWWTIEDEIAKKPQPRAAHEIELLPGLRHRAL